MSKDDLEAYLNLAYFGALSYASRRRPCATSTSRPPSSTSVRLRSWPVLSRTRTTDPINFPERAEFAATSCQPIGASACQAGGYRRLGLS